MNDSLLTISGAQIADLIRRGKTTSREAVEVHIEKIMKVNPVINAVVKDRFEEARKEADAADRKRKSSAGKNLPPYHGVPCTIKEAYALKGMPHTSGLVSRKNIVAQEDATAVARLRKAGAIPLGVTNVPELCMWFETYNKIYGRSNNPITGDDRRRQLGRRGSDRGRGRIPVRPRFGYRRVDQDAGLFQRRVRPQAHGWPGPGDRPLPGRGERRGALLHLRRAHAQGGGPDAAHADSRGTRRQRRLVP